MEYNIAPLEKRIKENIKNYNLDDLFRQEVLHKNLELLQKTFQMDICFTDRHSFRHGQNVEPKKYCQVLKRFQGVIRAH